MSLPGASSPPARRRTLRRVASTSSAAGPAPPTWQLLRRQLSALTTGVDLALCRLHYYLDRTLGYQVDLEASEPFQHVKVSGIDASFRADVKTYLLAVRSDIDRLEGAQQAVAASLEAEAAACLAHTARSAPSLPHSTSWRTPPGFNTSSSDSDGTHETNSRESQRRQRCRGRVTVSAVQLPTLPVPGNASESGGDLQESSADGGARGTVQSRQSRCSGRAGPGGLASAGCGASATGESGARAFGAIGAGDGSRAHSPGGVDDGSEGRGCPFGSIGAERKETYPSGGTETGGGCYVPPFYDVGTDAEHKMEVGRSADKCELPISTGEDNGGAQPSTSTSFSGVKFQVPGGGRDGETSGSASGESRDGSNSSSSSSRSAVDSGAREIDENLENLVRKWNQNKCNTASWSVARQPSPHPWAAEARAFATGASSTARKALLELHRHYGLLRRLLSLHSERLLRRTCTAALQPAAGQQLSPEQLSMRHPLSHAQLRRAADAARAELVCTRTILDDYAARAREFCEAARRLYAFRPHRPPRPPRRRRYITAAAAATPPPATPPRRWRLTQGGFSLEMLLSLCLCWSRPASD